MTDLDRQKLIVDDLIADYARAQAAYLAWIDAWRKRQSKKAAA